MFKYMQGKARFSAGLLAIFVAASAFAKESDLPLCERALIPNVQALNIVEGLTPQDTRYNRPLSSPAYTDPWLRLGRRVVAFPDFKFISDLRPNNLSPEDKRKIILQAKKLRRKVYDQTQNVDLAQKAYVRWVINHFFKFNGELQPFTADMVQARLQLNSGNAEWDKAFQGVEETWSKLTRSSPEFSTGSLLPSPFPVVVAGGRFRESYYWDAYFGALGLIETGRRDLAAAQLENFLHMIQTFGHVPNGFRDYYLSRSQPPVISMMAMAVYEDAAKGMAKTKLQRWMKERVFPLLRHDYHDFWMKRRHNPATDLNHYSDSLNEARPERHSLDDDTKLGATFRDVRAEAESGLDFTDALMGQASKVASVSLNALLYRYEIDLAKMAEMAGDQGLGFYYIAAAEKRRQGIMKYLWDGKSFRNYNFETGKHSDVVHADQFAMLYTGAATHEQAKAVVENVLPVLEKGGGLASSTSHSGKQWDGDHGWAPLHVMAIQGLGNYGYRTQADRLARKWVNSVAKIYAATGTFLEKIDARTGYEPVEDGTKYPMQTGFLWTNASYVWALKFLGLEFTPL